MADLSLLKSPWVVHFSCTSCNGCDIEVLASLTPRYDVERFGILNKGNPKFADVLVITGAVNPRSEKAVKNLFDQMPDPKAVIVVGSCGSTGGVFHDCYNIRGGVDTAIPVDVYVPGCPARPEAIIDGVVKALGIVKSKLEGTFKEEKPAPLELRPMPEKAEKPKSPSVAEGAEAAEPAQTTQAGASVPQSVAKTAAPEGGGGR